MPISTYTRQGRETVYLVHKVIDGKVYNKTFPHTERGFAAAHTLSEKLNSIAHNRVTDYDDAQVAIMSTRPRLLHDVMLGSDQSGVAFYGPVQLHEPNRFNEDLTSIDLYTI